ncbi:hypothetical protein EG68_00042 [Paragonimus skrjabini miyazakii]|uniref:Uncharacterized protein n=1 Tax=Paragonimus skrjabini miyazakii TaxID=59628 RepID=A0A8S9ZAI1_9TREM|nr:hypothetical protein EG68_00042 [Paragonimus skrjabini miyazakii]
MKILSVDLGIVHEFCGCFQEVQFSFEAGPCDARNVYSRTRGVLITARPSRSTISVFWRPGAIIFFPTSG